MNESQSDRRKTTIRVWDLPLRLFHWVLVVFVTISVYTGLTGGLTGMDVHMVSGQVILCLLAFRILWGFVGSRHARFAAFLRGPGAILAYLRDSRAGKAWTPGHNPLGALSVLALLGILAVQGVTGLFSKDDIFTEGPLVSKVTDATSKTLTGIHHLAADVLFVLLGLHVLAIIAYWLVKKDNLVRPMVTGRKEPPRDVEADDEPFASWWRAAVVAAVVAAGYWLVATTV